MIGVKPAAWQWVGQNAARFNANGGGRPGVLQGTNELCLEDDRVRSPRRIRSQPPGLSFDWTRARVPAR